MRKIFSNYVCFSKSLNFNKLPFHQNFIPYIPKKWVFQISDTTKMHLFKKQHIMRPALSVSKYYLVFYLNFNFVVKHCARKKHNIMSFKKTKQYILTKLNLVLLKKCIPIIIEIKILRYAHSLCSINSQSLFFTNNLSYYKKRLFDQYDFVDCSTKV